MISFSQIVYDNQVEEAYRALRAHKNEHVRAYGELISEIQPLVVKWAREQADKPGMTSDVMLDQASNIAATIAASVVHNSIGFEAVPLALMEVMQRIMLQITSSALRAADTLTPKGST